jgi:hypothetical protein
MFKVFLENIFREFLGKCRIHPCWGNYLPGMAPEVEALPEWQEKAGGNKLGTNEAGMKKGSRAITRNPLCLLVPKRGVEPLRPYGPQTLNLEMRFPVKGYEANTLQNQVSAVLLIWLVWLFFVRR